MKENIKLIQIKNNVHKWSIIFCKNPYYKTWQDRDLASVSIEGGIYCFKSVKRINENERIY